MEQKINLNQQSQLVQIYYFFSIDHSPLCNNIFTALCLLTNLKDVVVRYQLACTVPSACVKSYAVPTYSVASGGSFERDSGGCWAFDLTQHPHA